MSWAGSAETSLPLFWPETNANGGRVALGKLRLSLLEAMRSQDFAITFSIGAATFLSPPNSLDTLIRMANATMYAIKAKGKDNVSVCVMG
jgi:PleD family two-component response regulator